MTVMVTGPVGPVGHALVPLLASRDEVRAAVRREDDAGPLRDLGAKVTVGRLDDARVLAEVLRGVETLIHLDGGPDGAGAAEGAASALRSLEAARHAEVPRLLLLSVPRASDTSDDPRLRAWGLTEEAVIASGLDHAVIRSTHVCGLGSLWFACAVAAASATPPAVVGDGSQVLAPVAAEDVAAVLAGADDRAGPLAGRWAIEGPEVLTADGVARLLAGGDAAGFEHLHGERARARLAGLLGAEITAEDVAAIAAPSRADAPDAAAEFGVRLTPPAEAMRRALVRAAGPGG